MSRLILRGFDLVVVKPKTDSSSRPGSMMVGETVLQATEKVLGSFQHGFAVMADARREFERLHVRMG